MGDLVTLAVAIALTVGIYALSRRAFLTHGYPLLSPVLLSPLVIIAVLGFFRIPFARYKPAEEIMTVLLGPAVWRSPSRSTGSATPCCGCSRGY